jgi:hypothetical protein
MMPGIESFAASEAFFFWRNLRKFYQPEGLDE